MHCTDFHKAGYIVFGLHSFTGTACDCGDTECRSPGKHPLTKGWKYTPVWSDEQWDTAVELGQFDSGYGVLCKGLLVVDIDVRNGGSPDMLPECGLVVATGSGDGSLHGYYKLDSDEPLLQHLDEYPGVDFKSTGFVVGPGSRHVKGVYRVVSGSVDEIGPPPQWLLDKLKRPAAHRTTVDGITRDYTDDELRDILNHVPNDLHYEDYIKVGMAIHHVTKGLGFHLWDEWAQRSDKYTGNTIERRWQSFGQSYNPVTMGTLLYMADYPVTFTPTVYYDDKPDLDVSDVDLLRPPGFVGELAAWIESNNRRKRENLSVAAALFALGSVIGLKYTDDKDNVAANLFLCCVAGARTGKERPQECIKEVFQAAGIAKASAGDIKSEQEIMRNLTIRSQSCYLIIDELGLMLKKIKNAQKSGSAAYLEGVIKILLSAQGKANSSLGVSGDLYDFLISEFSKVVTLERKKESENERFSQQTIDNMEHLLHDLQTTGGIVKPFLSMIGFTTPSTFNDSVTYEMATNGFFGRAFIIIEPDNSPPLKPNYKPNPLPERLKLQIMRLYSHMEPCERIQWNYDRVEIPTAPDALAMLQDAANELDALAMSSEDGMEALYLGAYENITRVSLILAAAEGLRTVEHVRWAYALTLRDIRHKRALVSSNDDFDKGSALVSGLRHHLELAGDEGLSIGVIYNRMRQYSPGDVDRALEHIKARQFEHVPKRGPRTIKWKI